MNYPVALREDVLVCGTLEHTHGNICLREAGHYSAHVVAVSPGEYYLVQTACCPIAFSIPEVVAIVAINDRNWHWND